MLTVSNLLSRGQARNTRFFPVTGGDLYAVGFTELRSFEEVASPTSACACKRIVCRKQDAALTFATRVFFVPARQ
jgi:hypothetical protein